MEGNPAWLLAAGLAIFGLMGLSLVPALAALGFLLARRLRQARILFASALLGEAIANAALCFVATLDVRWPPPWLTGLSLLLARVGQFVAAIRNPGRYAVSLGFAAGAAAVVVTGTPTVHNTLARLHRLPEWLHRLPEWYCLPVSVASLLLAVVSLGCAVLVPTGTRSAESE